MSIVRHLEKLKETNRTPTGRPLLLGDIDQMVQSYIKAIRARGGHISYFLAEATAKVLIERHPEMNLEHIHIEDTTWARSFLNIWALGKGEGLRQRFRFPMR